MKAPALALCAATLFSGCSLVSTDEAAPPVSASLVVTDQAQYDARAPAGGLSRVVFDVPFEIRNTTGGPLYRIGCRTAPPPTLEKLVEGEWVTAYAPIVNLCLSPPFEIAPGEVRRDTLQVQGFLPGQNAGPEFETDVEGTYRLHLRLYSSLTDERSPLGKDLVPLEERVSNPFEVD